VAEKQGLADRPIDNRLTDLGTFLHANGVTLSFCTSATQRKKCGPIPLKNCVR
jgi:hypothetical protein